MGWLLPPFMTPAFWYSPTRFSKKLVFLCGGRLKREQEGNDVS